MIAGGSQGKNGSWDCYDHAQGEHHGDVVEG